MDIHTFAEEFEQIGPTLRVLQKILAEGDHIHNIAGWT